MSDPRILPGTPGLVSTDVVHIIIPGGGRVGGSALSERSLRRTRYAAALYHQWGLADRDGLIVCSGYKSPADVDGVPWSPPDAPEERFVGIPEADLMRDILLAEGISNRVIRVERHSIDTVTNFVRTEVAGYFDAGTAVAIVSQEGHLRRILDIVAPRTLSRPFLGVAVADSTRRTVEGMATRLASRVILFGVAPETHGILAITDRRAHRVWSVMNVVLRATRISTPYRGFGS